jgi:hypothetical protein
MPGKGQQHEKPIISITPSSNELPPATPEFIQKEVQKSEFSNQFDEKPSEIAARLRREEEEKNGQQEPMEEELQRPSEPAQQLPVQRNQVPMEIEMNSVVMEPEKAKSSPTKVQTPVQVAQKAEAPPKVDVTSGTATYASPAKSSPPKVQKTPERNKEEEKDELDDIMSGLAVAAGSTGKS